MKHLIAVLKRPKEEPEVKRIPFSNEFCKDYLGTSLPASKIIDVAECLVYYNKEATTPNVCAWEEDFNGNIIVCGIKNGEPKHLIYAEMILGYLKSSVTLPNKNIEKTVSVKADKIEVEKPGFLIIKKKCADGSVAVQVYDKLRSTINFKMNKNSSYWRNPYGVFELEPEVKERELVLSVVIKRPHKHKYLVALSNNIVSDFATVKTYDDVNAFIKPYVDKL